MKGTTNVIFNGESLRVKEFHRGCFKKKKILKDMSYRKVFEFKELLSTALFLLLALLTDDRSQVEQGMQKIVDGWMDTRTHGRYE